MNKRTRKSPAQTAPKPISRGEAAGFSLFSGFPSVSPRALYQAIEQFNTGRRKTLVIEHGTEEKQQIRSYDRLQMIALGRDLQRNSAKFIHFDETIRTLAFGSVKVEISIDGAEDWCKLVKKDFNSIFTRDCFFRKPMNLQEFVQLVESSIIREGDLLISFDDWLTGSGKLLVWEADQIAAVSDWEKFADDHRLYTKYAGKRILHKNLQGVVLDHFGRVVGYTVTSANLAPDSPKASGCDQIPADSALFIPAEKARLAARPFRFGQFRGVSKTLPVYNLLHDSDAMLKAELMSAKTAAHWVAFLEKNAAEMTAEEVAQTEEIIRQLEEAEEASSSASGSASPAPDSVSVPAAAQNRDFRKLSETTGGIIETLEKGEHANAPNWGRPNLNTETFYNQIGDNAGAVFGLTREYSRGAVESSYTAHRGETNITYRALKRFQKLAEWNYLDWILERRVSWLVDQGKLPAPPVDDWQFSAYWLFPGADDTNPGAQESAEAVAVRNGRKSLKESIGADWKQKISDTADVIKFAIEKGVPLSILETVAGAASPVIQIPEPEQKED